MFKHLRAGQRALLIDMPYQHHRHACLLGIAEQPGSALTHLADTAGRRLDVVRGDCLDRVDNKQFGLHFLYMGKDAFERCLGDHVAVIAHASEPVGTKFDLHGALLAAHIQHAARLYRQNVLEHERGFADTRLAADEHHRTGHKPPAQHAVQLLTGHVDAGFGHSLDLRHLAGHRFGRAAKR